MDATNRYLDRLAAHLGGVSDYRIAKVLEVGHSRISNYRTGRSTLDNAIAWKMAELLGIDAREIIAALEAVRAKDQGGKPVWIARLALLGGKAAAVAISGILLQAAPAGEARAATVSAGSAYFTMLNILHRIAGVARRYLPTFGDAPAPAFR
jgi:transcriptional regulator with XRE-family HTH domain